VLVRVADQVALAQHEGHPVRAEQPPGRDLDDPADALDVRGDRELAGHVDEVEDLVGGGRRRPGLRSGGEGHAGHRNAGGRAPPRTA
jgi:hypothetical protein